MDQDPRARAAYAHRTTPASSVEDLQDETKRLTESVTNLVISLGISSSLAFAAIDYASTQTQLS